MSSRIDLIILSYGLREAKFLVSLNISELSSRVRILDLTLCYSRDMGSSIDNVENSAKKFRRVEFFLSALIYMITDGVVTYTGDKASLGQFLSEDIPVPASIEQLGAPTPFSSTKMRRAHTEPAISSPSKSSRQTPTSSPRKQTSSQTVASSPQKANPSSQRASSSSRRTAGSEARHPRNNEGTDVLIQSRKYSRLVFPRSC